MKTKHSIGLLVALILSAGLALAQEPTPPPEPQEPSEDSILNTFSLFTDGGYLGIYAENISRQNMARYHMVTPRGVGITQVIQGSPAEKAGLKKDDVILRLDSENITSVRKLNRIVAEIAPDQSVKVTVSRGGAETELTATIGKRNNLSRVGNWTSEPRVFKRDPQGFFKDFKWETPLVEGFSFDMDKLGDLTFMLGNSRRIGVSTMQLNKQLADYFGIPGGKGTLVTAVTEDSPAAKAGVRAGDVITAIDGEAVDSPGDIARAINRKKEGPVTLTVIRNKSQLSFQVTPAEGGGFSGTMDQPQIGRRIVIPRIEIPVIPDIDIQLPAIRGPRVRVPAIDIQMPRIRVRPARVRLSRGERGPI
jgi:serine protease Do